MNYAIASYRWTVSKWGSGFNVHYCSSCAHDFEDCQEGSISMKSRDEKKVQFQFGNSYEFLRESAIDIFRAKNISYFVCY